jgi:translocation and assembly module TamB
MRMSRREVARGKVWRALRGLAIATGWVLGLGLVLALTIVLVLRTEPSATWAARQVLGHVQVYPNARVRLASLRVSPSGWIEVRGARLVEADTVQVVNLSRVRLHLDWGALSRGDVEIDSLRAELPLFDLTPLLHGLASRPAAAPREPHPRSTGRARVRIGHASVTAGDFRVPLTLHGGPATLVARGVELRASAVAVAPGVAGQLDSLGAALALEAMPHPAALFLRGSLRGGRATIDALHLDTPASHFDLRGTAPVLAGFDSLLANLNLDLAIQPADGVDLQPFLSGVPPGARLAATAHVALHGTAPAQASGGAEIAIPEARWAPHSAARVQLTTTWSDGSIAMQLDGEADGRPVALAGTLRPFDPIVPYELRLRTSGGSLSLQGEVEPRAGPRWGIAAGQFAHFDLSRLVPGAPASDLNGTLQATGRGLSPGSMSLESQLSLAASRVAAVPLDSLRVNATLRDGAAAVIAGARVHGTTASLDAQAHPFASEFVLDSAILRFQGFDLTRWASGARPPTDLSGTLTLAARGLEPRTRHATAKLQLLTSRIGDQAVRDGEIHAELLGDSLRAGGALNFPAGGLALQAEAQPFRAPIAYKVPHFEFTSLDLGALLGAPALHTQLTGRLSVEGEGTSPATMHASATLDLEPSTAGGVVLNGAHADAGCDAGAVRLAGDLQVPGGGGSVEASGMLHEPAPVYRAHGTLHSNDLARLLRRHLPEGSAELEFTAEGEGTDPHALHAHATLAGRGRLGVARLDSLSAALHIAGDTLRLDSLAVRSNVLRANAEGALSLQRLLPPAGESLHLTAALCDSAPLDALSGVKGLALAAGRLDATLRGSPTGAAVSVALDAEHISVDTLTAARVHVLASGSLSDDRRILAGRASATLDSLGIPRFSLGQVRASADFDGESLQASAAGALDDSTNFRVAAHGPLRREGVGVLDTLALQMGPDHWTLRHPVQVHFGKRFLVDDFQLVAGDQRVAVNGAFDRQGEHSLVAQVESLRLDGLARVLGWSRIAGRLTGDVQLSGPAPAPRGTGHVALELRSAGEKVAMLEARFEHEDNLLDLQARVTNPAGDSLTVVGQLPLALPGLSPAPVDPSAAASAPMDFRARAEGFELSALTALVPPNTLRDLAGQLWVDAHVTGTARAPHLEGSLRVERGAVRITSLGAPYTDISLLASLAEDHLQLSRLSVKSGRGTLQAQGGIRFGAPGALELTASLDRFRALATRQLRLEASGKLSVGGTLGAPVVGGSLTLTDTDINVSNAAGNTAQEVTLTEADLRMLEEQFGYRPLISKGSSTSVFESTTLGVVVKAGRDTWVRRKAAPRLALEITGSVDVRKQPHIPLQVFGRLEALPQRSYAEQLGRRFDIETGAVVLNGDPLQAQIDFVAKWEVPSAGNTTNPEATIKLGAKGTMDDLRLTFTSDPAMDETQILSYIATGRPPQGTTGQVQSSSGAMNTTEALAFGQASALVEDWGASLGLDVLQVRNDGVEGATMVAGNYVNPKTYLGIRQSATFETQQNSATSTGASTEIEVEYELLQWLLLNLQGGVGDLRLMFRSRYAY